MAFLTIVAPLIALTYPIDKIKDGKAQAFSMWLKEYIFNALLQPVHLLLYTIFVGMANEFAIENPLYAIVAIGFLVPAEKFFRKMFGMESQTSVGTIGAAAGGAMVMSMLNKMKGKPPKDEAEKQQKVRTADQNGVGGTPRQVPAPNGPVQNGPVQNGPVQNGPVQNGPVQNGPAQNGPVQNGPVPNGPVQNGPVPNGPMPNGPVPNGPVPNGPVPNGPGAAQRQVRVPTRPQKFWRATKAVAGHVGDKYIYGKEGRRRLRRTIIGAAGGLAAGTIGLAAGVASGDAGKALQYAGAGAAAGYIGAANLGENINSKVHSAVDTAKKGYMGTEAYNNAQFDKQFFKSDEYKIMEEKYGKDIKQDVQGYLSKGVTDSKEMEKMIKHGISAADYGDYKSNGLTDVNKMVDLAKEGISAEEYGALADEGITDVYKIKKIKEYNKKYGRNLTAKQLSERMKVARQIPKNAKDNITEFTKFVRTRLSKNWSDIEIKELYDSLYDLI